RAAPLGEPPGRADWQWHPRATPAESKCCCPGRPFLLQGPPALLCCTGCVLSAWFGVVVRVPSSSLSPLYRIFHVTTAPFSTSSRLINPALPEACKCVHSAPRLCPRVLSSLPPACF
uniref:Uncharacterized protein n=1 Tax=Rhinolophus ferrumequinum TaxID=59479 RepID=A0A671FML1_RHIFE